MVDNKKYRSYQNSTEWQAFFEAMKKIIDQICKKTLKLEDENDSIKSKYSHAFAEKEDFRMKYSTEKERFQKIQVDYETLEADVKELFKVEKMFNEMK